MKRRACLQLGLGFGLLSRLSWAQAAALHWEETIFRGFGTTLSIRAAHEDKALVQKALHHARETVARIEDQMSLFRPDSALALLNRQGYLDPVPDDLMRVLKISRDISARSQGAFDTTVQPLWTLFDNARQRGELPSSQQIEHARQSVGWQHVRLSPHKVVLTKPGMGITLNGIAQGYAADRVRAQLKQLGVAHALINTGEWSSLGTSPDSDAWRLGIADPHQHQRLIGRLAMQGECVATSADDQCTFSDDHRYHHIFNPHTGVSPNDISSVTVIAPSATQADALTKVLFVNGYEKALQFAKHWRVKALVINKLGKWQASPELLLDQITLG